MADDHSAEVGYKLRTFTSGAYHNSTLSCGKRGRPQGVFRVYRSGAFTVKSHGRRSMGMPRYSLERFGPYDDKIRKSGARDRFEEMISRDSKSVVAEFMNRRRVAYAYGLNGTGIQNMASIYSRANEKSKEMQTSNLKFVEANGGYANPNILNQQIRIEMKKAA